ncbi:MAG: LPS-assembly protein LptD [Gammaproteobacteria bacterium]
MRSPRALWLMLVGLAGIPIAVRGADAPCPASTAPDTSKVVGSAPKPEKPPKLDDGTVEFSADDAKLNVAGDASLKGNVLVKQGEREIRADDVQYSQGENSFKVEGDVDYDDPMLHATGGGGNYSATRGADFRDAEFQLKERSARGKAGTMQLSPEGLITLQDVSFTTCPVDDTSWQLRAKEISLDTKTRIGTGRGTRVDFKGVPILYLPWMSFPLGTERKSGFLFPTIGHSTRSGAQLALPYYWNIAPNADLTFEPTYYSRRGLDVAGEIRLLTSNTLTKLTVNYLPNDSIEHRDRNRFALENRTELPQDFRFFINAESVSDSGYFEDFAQGPAGTSVAFLERNAGVSYRDEHWRMTADVQQFQTIDQDLADVDRPYARLPRVAVSADYGWGPEERLRYGFDSEIVNFDRSIGVTGWRLDAMPQASLDFGAPGFFVRPGFAWRYTQYDLKDAAPGQRSTPTRSLPITSLDAGMIFERESGSRGQRRVTLEPRLLYLNAPFRQQDDLPLFDTGLPDLNLVQLFRTNRYVGADRVSDANQVSLGVTSRLFDAKNGAQFLSATLGQIYYFENPRVHLPDEPVRTSGTSDFVAQLAVTAYKDWNVDFGLQWNPDQDRSERAQVNLQYKPESQQVVNVGYRFQRDSLEQAEVSTAWPIGKNWNAFARYVYSLQDDKALEQFGGLEYSSCCWRMRLVGRKFVSTRTGEQDTGIYLQLELTGLASVGSAADAFLAGAIRGYERPVTKP